MTFSFSSVSYLGENPTDLFSHISSLQTPHLSTASPGPHERTALQNEFYLPVVLPSGWILFVSLGPEECTCKPRCADLIRAQFVGKQVSLLLGVTICFGICLVIEFPEGDISNAVTCEQRRAPPPLVLPSRAQRGQRASTGGVTEKMNHAF